VKKCISISNCILIENRFTSICMTDLKPFKKSFVREINDDDLQKLTQIPMIRITRFDSDKADDFIQIGS
jgi:hypothetical protein